MTNSWNFMKRFKPSHRSITDMAWLKLMCGLQDGPVSIAKPMSEYLLTPIKHCRGLCPSRYRNPKRFSKSKWSHSSWGIFKQDKPTLDVYLKQMLSDYRSERYKLQKTKVRLQNLRIRRVPKRRSKVY